MLWDQECLFVRHVEETLLNLPHGCGRDREPFHYIAVKPRKRFLLHLAVDLQPEKGKQLQELDHQEMVVH